MFEGLVTGTAWERYRYNNGTDHLEWFENSKHNFFNSCVDTKYDTSLTSKLQSICTLYKIMNKYINIIIVREGKDFSIPGMALGGYVSTSSCYCVRGRQTSGFPAAHSSGSSGTANTPTRHSRYTTTTCPVPAQHDG